MNIHEELTHQYETTGSQSRLSEIDVTRIKDAFVEHPEWGDDLYLFADGHLEGGKQFRNQKPLLTNKRGIPVNISKGHSQIRLYCKLSNEYTTTTMRSFLDPNLNETI